MRIVREPNEIAVQLVRPAEQRSSVLLRPGAAAAIRRLGVDVDAAQKDRLAVEQNLVALHLDGAEADVVVEVVVPCLHLKAIELGMLGRPADQVLRREGEFGVAIGIGGGLLRETQLGNAERDGGSGTCAYDVNVALDLVAGAAFQLKRIVVDVALRNIDKDRPAGSGRRNSTNRS